jgi:hypothetical protein
MQILPSNSQNSVCIIKPFDQNEGSFLSVLEHALLNYSRCSSVHYQKWNKISIVGITKRKDLMSDSSSHKCRERSKIK